MSDDRDITKKSRREFLRQSGALVAAALPTAALASADTGEGVTVELRGSLTPQFNTG